MPPRVSVVTPFFNTEQYLNECIESVLAQTFPDFEYLLVDNCSTDRSPDIARKYACADSRIRLLTNAAFVGQVENYNGALAQISPHSNYCKIVQADDWLYPRCLEEMVTRADTDPSIGIVSSYRLAGTAVKEVGLPHTARVSSGRAICRLQLLNDCHFFGSPSTLLLRSEIVRSRQPFYELGRLHEDTEACYSILKNWSFGFVHQVLSFTRTDNDSIMSATRAFNPYLLDRLIIFSRFGRDYLEAAEFAEHWRRHENRYLDFLARARLQRRSQAFWEYHERGMASIGYRPKCTRSAARIARVICKLALDPRSALNLIFSSSRAPM
jgi:glycosyltransferase involved in cell wall biosynthesis